MGNMGQGTRWMPRVRLALVGLLLAGLFSVLPFAATPVQAVSTTLVITQVYGGGNNSGATYRNDFIEIFNLGTATIDLSAYTVQYFGSTGSSGGAAQTLAGMLAPGRYYLIQEAGGTTNGVALPPPDLTPASPFAMSGTNGRVDLASGATLVDRVGYGSSTTFEGTGATGVLSNSTAALRKSNGCTDTDNNNSDFDVLTPAPRNTGTAANVCGLPVPAITLMPMTGPATGGTSVTITGTNTNFVQATTTVTFGGAMATSVTVNSATSITAVAPPAANMAASSTVNVVVTTGSETATATAAFTYIVANAPTITNIRPAYGPTGGGTTVTITGTNFAADSTVSFGGTPGTVVGIPTATSIAVTTPAGAAGAVNVAVANPTAGTSVTATNAFAYVADPAARIHDIQGAAHRSSRDSTAGMPGQAVTGVPGIVTAKTSGSFYIQEDPAYYDANVGTSEGILVFGSAAAGMVTVGNVVVINASVEEFRNGRANSGPEDECSERTGGEANLCTTQLENVTSVTVLVTTSTLPEPVVIGIGGRQIPAVYAAPGSGTADLNNPAGSGIAYDATLYAVDFFESLEGMRVQVNDAKVVGPRANTFGEFVVVPDNGAALVGKQTIRGGVYITAPQDNTQRIFFDDTLTNLSTTVNANVGDRIMGATVGIIDYSFGNYKFNITSLGTYVSGGIMREATALVGDANRLTIGNFNVENLQPGNPQSKFDTLAGYIRTNLNSPDIVVLEEIQDNNGATNDSVVAADMTYTKLIEAITAAGGPAYQFRQIDPVDDQDGGEPGGNIRVGFLFNPARVAFVDRAGATATTPNGVVTDGTGTHLQFSPGRIDPTNPAFNSSRKPLAGEFVFNGNRVFVIGNHFNSKGGDTPLYGRFQPIHRPSEVQRQQQALIVHNFVRSLLTADANAKVVVAGDINDYQFSDTLKVLRFGTATPATGATPILEDLIERFPLDAQYTYVFEGNSQVLDHILVSTNLSGAVAGTGESGDYDVVHINSEFFDQQSDHEPEVVRLTLLPVPTITAVAPNRGPTGGGTSVTITGTGFRSGATVAFDGAMATSVTVVNDTTITAVTPAGGAGPKNIVVRNSDMTTSNAGAFLYEQPNIMPVPMPTRMAAPPLPMPMMPLPAPPMRPAVAPMTPMTPTPLPAPMRR